MIDLPTNRLRPGMVVAQSIYNSSGASYITKGTALTKQYVDRLRMLGVEGIHVASTATAGINVPVPEDVLSEETRAFAVKRVGDMFAQVSQEGTFELEPMMQASSTIVNDIMARRGNLVQLTDIRVHDMYTFAHSVNVATLSALIGVLVGLDNKMVSELVLGGLLHDLGKTMVPTDILNKPSSLTDIEFTTIKNHPTMGADKIVTMLNLPNAERLSIQARQHHEKLNGTGYPNGLKGKEIHLYGRICAIADVYDALTSARPYKRAYTPAIAYNIMANCSPGQFDTDLLNMFFSNVAIYPVGTVVKTTLGHAIVKNIEFGKTNTPTIIVFANRDGKLLDRPLTVDMSRTPEAKIETVINDMELFHFIHNIHFDPAQLIAV